MRRQLGWLAILLFWAVPVSAQVPADPCASAGLTSLATGTPYKVCMNHDGQRTIDYTLTIDRPGTATDLTQTKPVSSLTTGAVIFDVAAATVGGTYTAKVCARGDGGTTCSDVLAFTVVAPPLPLPPLKPGIRIYGMATIAGQRVPIVLDVEKVVMR